MKKIRDVIQQKKGEKRRQKRRQIIILSCFICICFLALIILTIREKTNTTNENAQLTDSQDALQNSTTSTSPEQLSVLSDSFADASDNTVADLEANEKGKEEVTVEEAEKTPDKIEIADDEKPKNDDIDTPKNPEPSLDSSDHDTKAPSNEEIEEPKPIVNYTGDEYANIIISNYNAMYPDNAIERKNIRFSSEGYIPETTVEIDDGAFYLFVTEGDGRPAYYLLSDIDDSEENFEYFLDLSSRFMHALYDEKKQGGFANGCISQARKFYYEGDRESSCLVSNDSIDQVFTFKIEYRNSFIEDKYWTYIIDFGDKLW